MASSTNGLVASGQVPEADSIQQFSLIEHIAYFERQSSVVRRATIDIAADRAERLQSAACFEAWAMPESVLPPRH